MWNYSCWCTGLGMESKPSSSMHCGEDTELKAWHLGLKKNTYVSANMPKKIRVGRSENLFNFYQIFIC